MAYTYEHPRPSVTVDVVVFTVRDGALQVLLIRRGQDPFKDRWALPGGFVREDESLEAAARRELAEETGVADVYFEQLCTFGDPGRDPRGHVITVAYYALIRSDEVTLRATADAAAAAWHPVGHLPALAFDHPTIVDAARDRLRAKLGYTTLGFQLLPRKFTLPELQRLYETILGRTLDKRNFRKKIRSLDLVREEAEMRANGAHRPARLYSFKHRKPRYFDDQIV